MQVGRTRIEFSKIKTVNLGLRHLRHYEEIFYLLSLGIAVLLILHF